MFHKRIKFHLPSVRYDDNRSYIISIECKMGGWAQHAALQIEKGEQIVVYKDKSKPKKKHIHIYKYIYKNNDHNM